MTPYSIFESEATYIQAAIEQDILPSFKDVANSLNNLNIVDGVDVNIHLYKGESEEIGSGTVPLMGNKSGFSAKPHQNFSLSDLSQEYNNIIMTGGSR